MIGRFALPLRDGHLYVIPCSCGFGIPFGVSSLARQSLPFSDFSALAIQGHPFPDKRNGVAKADNSD